MHGWMGKILQVDLNNSEITEFSSRPYAEKYLGGRGIASRIYWETVKPETKAFDPDNRLIFMAGTLVASGAQAANRMSVVGKSPMTVPEGFCYGNIGGFFGAEMKQAGYDGIVITGRSSKPVYLNIYNDKVELCDAASLWGRGALEVEKIVRQVHGEKARFLTTGIAGENRVRSAILYGSHQSTATAGFGAVMASKNLKAIVVRGTGKVSVADSARLNELNRYTIKICQRLHLAVPPLFMGTNHGHLLEVKGKGGCDRCGIICNRNVYLYGKRLLGNRRCQAMEYYLPWRCGRDDEPVDTVFDAPTLANDYSIGTWELQNIIDWLYACYKSGSLTDEDIGLPLSSIGTRDFLEKLLHAIAHREGFGDILAEGLFRSGEKLPPKARALFSRFVAPIGQMDLVPPRAVVAHALIYPMEPRVHQPVIHEIAFINAAWTINNMEPGSTNITTRVVHDIARAFWGSDAAGYLSSYEGKPLAAYKIQNRTYTKDALGLCDFTWPITYSFVTPDHVGDPHLEEKIFTAVTGVDSKEIANCSERIANVQRAIMVREGRKTPEDDYPLEYNFTVPLGLGARGEQIMVPGPGNEAVDASGNVLDREKFAGMLKEYYQLRGWDEDTGLPRPGTLARLGLDDLLPSFKRN